MFDRIPGSGLCLLGEESLLVLLITSWPAYLPISCTWAKIINGEKDYISELLVPYKTNIQEKCIAKLDN